MPAVICTLWYKGAAFSKDSLLDEISFSFLLTAFSIFLIMEGRWLLSWCFIKGCVVSFEYGSKDL